MQVSTILDFTRLIKEPKNAYKFNPSVAYWKENLYLCSYRIFIRYKNLEVGEYSYDSKYDPNHPWLGGRESDTFWQPVDGYDLTGFFILKIDDDEGMKNVKSFNDGKSIYVSKYKDKDQFERTNLKHIFAPDTRILHIADDLFLISYNVYKRDESMEISKSRKCSEKNTCTLIATRFVEIKNGNLHIYEEHIVCPHISEYTEKNWSFWLYNKDIFFSYGLAPEHKIYKYIFNEGLILCEPLKLSNDKLYGKYEEMYNKDSPILKISVSTPAIPRKNYKDRYIGVGHIKYLNGEDFVKLKRETPLGNFYFKNTDKIKHQTHDYLMFIYEFDPRNGEILTISDMFIPEKTNYMLCFPTGLEYNGDNLMIFYGDHDSTCNVLTFEDKILDKIMVDPSLETLETLKTINYFFFPETCIDKKGFCALLYEL